MMEREETREEFSLYPITYPQLTQAMVPWPFTVCATSDSSFRWESPDVAAEERRNYDQSHYRGHSKAPSSSEPGDTEDTVMSNTGKWI